MVYINDIPFLPVHTFTIFTVELCSNYQKFDLVSQRLNFKPKAPLESVNLSIDSVSFCLGVWGLGFRLQGLWGFRVWVLGALGFRASV